MVKVFSMAHSTTGIDEQQVCDPLLYLVHNKHRLPGGNFVEDNPVYDTTMTVSLSSFLSHGPRFVFLLLNPFYK